MGLVGTVVDAAIGWVVQTILESFFTTQMKAWTQQVGLAEDVEKLEFEMNNVQMVLAAAKGRNIDNEPLARSLDNLKGLLYDAEDVMDELDYYRFQQQIKEGKSCSAATGTDPHDVSSSNPAYAFELVCSARNKITSWTSCGRKRKHGEEEPNDSSMQPLDTKHDISKRINGIVNRLSIIGKSVKRVLQLEISSHIATSNQIQSVARNARLTTSVPIECKVYGRDAERDKIIEFLINKESSDLQILSLVGIGGVGKTTLARIVYRDERIEDHFDLQMWICVSTSFDEVRLTREILEHVCEDRQQYENITNFNVLQQILLKKIRHKRFLLVLDDIWEDKDRSGWAKLLALLRSNQASGCMVLATTRRKSVAKMIGTTAEVDVNGLDEEEFWMFFKACAFGSENYVGHPSLQSIGRHIAKALKGCPLAALSVGALLNTSVSHEHWSTVQDKWKYLQAEEGDILPILKLSYDYLPVPLQHCFAYCSLFPEDHRFSGENLVRAWISQNFVQCEETIIRLEETGQLYLDSLVDLGFFQKVNTHYVMHDLMHELAEKVSSNECATIHGLKWEAVHRSVRHLSIITTAYDKDEYGYLSSENFEKILQNIGPLQKLRTLMLFGRCSANLLCSIHTLCKEAKYLRFLRIYVTGSDLSSVHNSLHPCHLRYLECVWIPTKNTPLHQTNDSPTLPQTLSRFYHLQVLDMGFSGHLAIPTGVNNLINLRHLIAHEKLHCSIASVGNMTSLQELKFKVRNVGGFEIRQLQSMNRLVTLEISQLENVKTKEEARGARLIDKEYLKVLSLSWDDSSMNLEPERRKDVLEGFQPHQSLKTLKIIGYGGPAAPTWLSSNTSVISLQTLRLENCREWRTLPSLEMLPFLRKLKLVRMRDLVEILIPSLEELVLMEMPKLKKCFGTYGMELTCNLRVLMIKNCPQLSEFTLFQSYSSFEAEQKTWFPSLHKLIVRHCPRIINWEILPLKKLEALIVLELEDLHVVRELSVPSLKKLMLINMPILESCSGLTACPPLQISPSNGEKEWLSSLRRLTILYCPSLVVSHPFSDLICKISTKGVRTFRTMRRRSTSLMIESSESVFDDRILAFYDLRRITSLTIQNCPNLIYLPSECFNQLTALNSLVIIDCHNLLKSHIVSSSVILPSLKALYISSCGIAGRWLTQMLPHVQSLVELTIRHCEEIKLLLISQPTEAQGTSSLASAPTAVTSSGQDGRLLKIPYNVQSSLKRLFIYHCEDLEFCGGKGDFGRFTSLVRICLECSPKLVSSLVTETKDDGTVDVGLLPPLLEELHISNPPERMQYYAPQGLVRLKRLILSNRYLTSVQLHSLTALKKLGITECKHVAVLEGLQSLSSLRSLSIYMNPELSAAWDHKLLPPSLKALSIHNLTDNVQSRVLTGLPRIIRLKLSGSPELTYLQLGHCAALKALHIMNCESLSSIEGLQSTRNLKYMRVRGFGRLTSSSEIWSRLETLAIDDFSVLSVPICKQLTSLRHLEFGTLGIKHDKTVVSLTDDQERAFQLLTSLQDLMFYSYPDLMSLPALYSLSSLGTLHISDCSSIVRLPERGFPPSLSKLVLSGCSEELCVQCKMEATKKLRVFVNEDSANKSPVNIL